MYCVLFAPKHNLVVDAKQILLLGKWIKLNLLVKNLDLAEDHFYKKSNIVER